LNKIATYSFLSVINNSEHKKINLDHIFYPIIDTAICFLNNENINSGNLSDLNKKILNIFSLDIPPSLLKKFIESKQKVDAVFMDNFQLFSDNSFQFDKYHFSDYSDKIEESKSDVEKLYSEYIIYLKNNDINIIEETEDKLTGFLSHNHIIVSKFFTEKKQLVPPVSDFLTQVEFLNSIIGKKYLFDIAKRIYFGSLISSYLKFDFSNIFTNEVEFVLDTNFILALLGFNSVSKTDTALRIVKIANEIGINLFIIDEHFKETKNFLNRKAEDMQSFRGLHKIKNDDFYRTCEEKKLDKTEIQRITNKLEELLSRQNISILHKFDEGFIDSVKNSELYSKQKKRIYNRKGAFADSVAIEYVRKKRGIATSDFSDSKAWFVCYPLEDHYPEFRNDGDLYETIFAETLLNILWLTNPAINGHNLDDLGLKRLISETIDASLPSRGVLLEIEEKMELIVKNEHLEVSEKDCFNVSSVVAHSTVKRQISLLNELKDLKNNEKDFAEKMKEISKIEKEKKEALSKEKYALKSEVTNINSKLVDKEQEVKANKLIRIRQLEIECNNLDQAIISKKDRLKERNSAFNRIEDKAKSILRKVLLFFITSYLLLIILLFFSYGFKTITPYYSFFVIIVVYFFNVIKLKKFDYNSFIEEQIKDNINKLVKKFEFDLTIIDELNNEIKELTQKKIKKESEINELDESLKQE
jgi:hypothetical protein